MKRRDKKSIPYKSGEKELLRNYNLKMQILKKSPRVYYDSDGGLRSIKPS